MRSQVGREAVALTEQEHESCMQIIQPYFLVSFLITKQTYSEQKPRLCYCGGKHAHAHRNFPCLVVFVFQATVSAEKKKDMYVFKTPPACTTLFSLLFL